MDEVGRNRTILSFRGDIEKKERQPSALTVLIRSLEAGSIALSMPARGKQDRCGDSCDVYVEQESREIQRSIEVASQRATRQVATV